jgi:hypothetical protein
MSLKGWSCWVVNIRMDDAEKLSLEAIARFVAASGEIRFEAENRQQLHGWVEQVLATLTRLVIQRIDVWPTILLLNFSGGFGRCNPLSSLKKVTRSTSPAIFSEGVRGCGKESLILVEVCALEADISSASRSQLPHQSSSNDHDCAGESSTMKNRSVFRPQVQRWSWNTHQERYNLRESATKKEIPVYSGGCNPLGAGGREPGRAAGAERRVRIDALQRGGPKKHRPLT